MFVICGEALIDIFIQDNTQLNSTKFALEACVGGSPFNVAIGLARLKQPVSLLAGISNDMFGKRLISVLKDEGVSQELIIQKQLPTTVAFIEKDQFGVPSYSFLGEGSADRALLEKDVELNIETPTGIHVGSYCIVMKPTSESLLSLVKQHAGKCLISLDPNVRAIVEPDMTVWRNRVDELIVLTDILKVSDEDLEMMYPDIDPESVIQKWLETGLKLAVLTRGAEGSTLWSGIGKVDVQTPKVEVIDTVGAGDTYQSALLDSVICLTEEFKTDWVSQLTSDKLREIGAYSAAAAAITCSRQGANLPSKHEVHDFLKA